MPSLLHEVLVAMFRDHPEFAVDVMDDILGIDLPTYTHAHAAPADLTNLKPTEFRADVVITLSDDNGPIAGVIVEAQLDDETRKRFSWPAYVANLYARLECPVYLLAVCPTTTIADWCAQPILTGCMTLTPIVLGPEQIQLTDEAAPTRHPIETAVLSALLHGSDQAESSIYTLLSAIDDFDQEDAVLYIEALLPTLSRAALESLEMRMSIATPELRKLAEQSMRDRAVAAARADDVLDVLDTRGIELTPEQHDRIYNCADIDLLKTWIRRAVTVSTAEELLSPVPPAA